MGTGVFYSGGHERGMEVAHGQITVKRRVKVLRDCDFFSSFLSPVVGPGQVDYISTILCSIFGLA